MIDNSEELEELEGQEFGSLGLTVGLVTTETEEEKKARLKAEADAAAGKGKEEEGEEEEEKEESEENEEEEEEEEGEPVDPFVEIGSKFGAKIEKKYEPNEKGLEEFVSDLTPTIKKLGEQEFLEENPQLKELKEHLDSGYTVESFKMKKEYPDYEKLEIEADNVELQKKVINVALRTKGLTDDEAEELIAAYETKGVLLDKANDSKKELVQAVKKEIDAVLQKEKAEWQKVQDDLAEFEKNYKISVEKDELGIKLSPEDKKRLYEFSFKTDEKGKTQRDLKLSKLTPAQDALIDYLIMNDFKLTGLDLMKATKKASLAFEFGENKKRVKPSSKGGGSTTEQRLPANLLGY